MQPKQRRPLRHGDVLLIPVATIPQGAAKLSTDIVAEGEVTGHAHRLVNALLFEHSGRRYVEGTRNGLITHEEHGAGRCVGNFEVIIQREYDDEHEWRKVVD